MYSLSSCFFHFVIFRLIKKQLFPFDCYFEVVVHKNQYLINCLKSNQVNRDSSRSQNNIVQDKNQTGKTEHNKEHEIKKKITRA